MDKTTQGIQETLTLILEKLGNIETEITNQREDVNTYLKTMGTRTDLDDRLISRMYSLTTSVELLRDEVDELHALVIVLFRESDDDE